MNWLKGVGIFLAVLAVGVFTLPILGLTEGLVEAVVWAAGLGLFVVALFETPQVLARGHRKAKGSYELEKVED